MRDLLKMVARWWRRSQEMARPWLEYLGWPWTVVPGDARRVVLVAFAMPFLLHTYYAAPWLADKIDETDDQRVARIIFSVALAVCATLVGHLISRGGPRAMPERQHRLEERIAKLTAQRWQAYKGHVVGVAGFTFALMAILSLDAPWLATDDKTMTWRLLTGLAQGAMVAGWIILWRIRRRWLSRSAAAITAAASGVAFALSIVSNFLLADPATSSWGWGVIHERSVVARVTGVAWLEPLIAAMMLLALTMLLRRWWRRAQAGVSP